MQVKEVMSSNVEYCNIDTPITEIAKRMKNRNIGAVFIGDENQKDERSGEQGKIVGCITDRDIAIKCIAEDKNANECTAEHIMSKPVFWCHENDNVVEASKRMEDKNVLRLLVVSDQDKLAGVIAHSDIADACFQKRQKELQDEVAHMATKHKEAA
jgi:CBS domain-containing protein